MAGIGVRPELTELTDEQRQRVYRTLRRRRPACGACGARDFDVGDALFLGFLFRSEDPDAYLVALTCRNPECSGPYTGIRLRAGEFLRT